jgi:predicted membrane channel-forming protein YqfA (hemolysin III family)
MEFIQHSINWIKGEIFEAYFFGAFGVLLMLSSLMLWKFGETPNSKALIIPLILIGVFFFGTAISGINSNNKRLPEFKEAFEKNKTEFIQTEKERVESFQYLYKMTIIVASICFLLAICAFVFTKNSTLRAIGIALVIFGITGLIIDYFSKERADNYYKIIIESVEK